MKPGQVATLSVLETWEYEKPYMKFYTGISAELKQI
jgi:hypothetical protein